MEEFGKGIRQIFGDIKEEVMAEWNLEYLK